MNLIQFTLRTKSVSTLRKNRSRYNDQKRKPSSSSIPEFVKTVTMAYCYQYIIQYMMSQLDDKLFNYYNNLFFNFNASYPVNSEENKRQDPTRAMEIPNTICKFIGTLSKPKDSQCSFKNKLTKQNLELLDAESTMSTDYSSSLSSSNTSDNNVWNYIRNELNDVGRNIGNENIIECEEKTNDYSDILYEDELRHKIEQELQTKSKGEMSKGFYERELQKQLINNVNKEQNDRKVSQVDIDLAVKEKEDEFIQQFKIREGELIEKYEKENNEKMNDIKLEYTNKNTQLENEYKRKETELLNKEGILRNEIKQELQEQFKSQLSTLQSALNESRTNNASQRTEIEEERKKNKELQNENNELRRQLKDKENDFNCLEIGIRYSLSQLRFAVRNRDEMKNDVGHESDSESSVLTELSEPKANDTLYVVDMPLIPVPIDPMIDEILTDKLKDELRQILAKVILHDDDDDDDDDEDEPKLDACAVMNVLGKSNAGAVSDVFDQLTDASDDCDVEFTIDAIIDGIIESDDLKNKLIKSFNIKIENDINTVDMDNMAPLILSTTETKPNSEPFVPAWKK